MTPSVRVLHFVEAAGGGVLSVIFDSIAQLRAQYPGSFEFSVLYSRRAETPQDFEELCPDVSFYSIKVGRKLFSPRDIGTILKVARFSNQFDVVHCHSSRAGFIGRLARLFGGRRRVLYSPHCYGFLSQEFSPAKRSLIYIVEKLLSRIPGTTTIACGDSEFLLSKDVGGRSVVVRNGCDALKRTYSADQSVPLVVGMGRDSIQKDPGSFLAVACALDKIGSFEWIGALRSPLATGWLARHAAVDALTKADIFLMTSRWEGLPVAGLEAMSIGMPLVVRDIPGARDLVQDGVNGFLFSTVDEAIEKVRLLIEDKPLRLEMGTQSSARFNSLFTCRNYLSLFALYTAGTRLGGAE